MTQKDKKDLENHCDHLCGMVEDIAGRWFDDKGQNAPCAFESRLETIHYYLRNLSNNLHRPSGEIKMDAWNQQDVLRFIIEGNSQ
jgi:hypothetical protein